MKHIIWFLKWLLKAAIFFTLFAFALNNQQDVMVQFFFGTYWRTPLVLVVLAAFTAGVAIGILGMVPRWWQQRKIAATKGNAATGNPANSTGVSPIAPTHVL